MIQDKYVALPNGMRPPEVQKAFDDLFAEIDADGQLKALDVLEAFYELADRQWHSYSILPSTYKQMVEEWIKSHWMPNSLEFITQTAFITGALGLPGILEMLQKEVGNPHLDPDVQSEIAGAVKEIGGKIDDPYSGMPKK